MRNPAQSVHVIARAHAKPGKEAAFRDALLALVEPTRKEAGCLRYNIYENPADPSELAAIEEWTSEQAHAAHLATPHVQLLFARAEELLAAPPDLRRYRLTR